MSYGEVLGDKSTMHVKSDLILRVLDYIVIISFGVYLLLWLFNLFSNVWVCVCVFCNV